ncbi:MAG: leucine-rich repeat domain-containing protein, partial [Lachnospiraceae bacterium]|nr:leucine-rich repeat domain-containing protein [Lachnospiraceae bacterium]
MLKRKDKKNAKQNDWHRAAVMLLVCSLLLSLVPEVMAKKKTSGNFYDTKWSYNTKRKTLTLSCKGRMDDEYSSYNGGYWAWHEWSDDIQKAVVKEGVTYLGEGTFHYCRKLKQVTLPKSLKEIGTDAFMSSGISEITLPNQLKKISEYAFWDSELKEIKISKNVTQIGRYAFWNCKKLEKVTLSPNLKKISQAMFCQCVKLKTITLPKNITRIENGAFYESGLTNITIPKKVTTIEKEVFYHCTSLKKVTFETQKLKTISS